MCRNIRTLFNFDPPATDDEVRAAAVQFVRKLSGFTAPSKANQAGRSIGPSTRSPRVARRLIDDLVTAAEPRNREVEARTRQGAIGDAVRRRASEPAGGQWPGSPDSASSTGPSFRAYQ